MAVHLKGCVIKVDGDKATFRFMLHNVVAWYDINEHEPIARDSKVPLTRVHTTSQAFVVPCTAQEFESAIVRNDDV